MTENEVNARLEELETRLMHQEASIDELTRALIVQEQLVSKQAEVIKRLQAQVKDIGSSNGSPGEEVPPHY